MARHEYGVLQAPRCGVNTAAKQEVMHGDPPHTAVGEISKQWKVTCTWNRGKQVAENSAVVIGLRRPGIGIERITGEGMP